MNNRFIVQKGDNANSWVCTDQINKIVCVFQQGQFNETQIFTMLDEFDASNYMTLARITREMADYLLENHYEKLFD